MKKRNGEIDFLKFVFAIIIAGYHASIFYNSESYTLWPTGYIGVEFYFIVAGFLLAKVSIPLIGVHSIRHRSPLDPLEKSTRLIV